MIRKETYIYSNKEKTKAGPKRKEKATSTFSS